MCAGRCGQLLNLSSLANDCGITHNTAASWISVLQASFIIFLLQPYHKNFGKRLVKTPKLYFYDTGIVSSLLGIQTPQQLTTHYLRGNLFETLIISEFYKYRLHQALAPNFYFWRDKSDHEIDCLIEGKHGLTAVEIKSSKTASEKYFEGLHYWQKLLEGHSLNNYVIYAGHHKQKRQGGTLLGWKDVAFASGSMTIQSAAYFHQNRKTQIGFY